MKYTYLLATTTMLCASAALAADEKPYKRGITLYSEDGLSLKAKGRLQLDAATFDDDNRHYPGNQDVRRARLALYGTINDEWSYSFENNFVNKYWNIGKTYLTYKPKGTNWTYRIGQDKTPTGLENSSSSLSTTFLERAAPTSTLLGGTRGGASARYTGDNWSLHGGVYDEAWGQKSSNDEGWEMGARATFAPYKDGNNVVHLGASMAREFPDENATSRFRSRPDSRLTDSKRAVDTGTLSNVKYEDKVGAELIAQFNGITWQSEYAQTGVDRDSGAQDVTFDGWYSELSYSLTGEERSYKSKGYLGGIMPAKEHRLQYGGWGAWQVAARFSSLDLNDGVITGGKMETSSLGVNWYPHEQIRVMLNQTFVDTDQNASVANDNPKVTALRLQFVF